MEAGKILASSFTESFFKTIKFKEKPKLDELLKQLKLIYTKFDSIYCPIENLTLTLE